ncbi:hypothetical protein CsSME_00017182 [Camellia sinensis var. sinensis]
MVLQKASGFLVSSKSHAVAEERELDDHVYSNDDYADTASLLEQEMRHEPSNQSGLRFISGIISKSKLLSVSDNWWAVVMMVVELAEMAVKVLVT